MKNFCYKIALYIFLIFISLVVIIYVHDSPKLADTYACLNKGGGTAGEIRDILAVDGKCGITKGHVKGIWISEFNHEIGGGVGCVGLTLLFFLVVGLFSPAKKEKVRVILDKEEVEGDDSIFRFIYEIGRCPVGFVKAIFGFGARGVGGRRSNIFNFTSWVIFYWGVMGSSYFLGELMRQWLK